MIYKFEPYLKSVIWGGEKIAARKGIADAPESVGESWELSGVPGHESVVAEGPEKGMELGELIRRHKGELVGEEIYRRFGDKFPLLVKIIDARQNLSVQVHPDDELASRRHNSFGKTEMWYILETEPDAHIYAGLSKEITPEEYIRLVEENRIMEVVADMQSAPGDVYFLPAGRIHAIGAGNLLAEIQQTSDITYRVYDYDRRDAQGNPRELHTEQAREAIDYTVYPEYRSSYNQDTQQAEIAHCDYFNVNRVMVDGKTEIPTPEDSFTILICTQGTCEITADDGSTASMSAYETALMPASVKSLKVSGHATLLTATA